MYYNQSNIENLPHHKWVKALKTLYTYLVTQATGTTVDTSILVKYINKVSEVTETPVWEIYGNIYRTGKFDFKDKPAEMSKIAYLKQTGKLREVAKIVMDKYSYEDVKVVRKEVRKQVKTNAKVPQN